ncbi:hypothetical protein PENTCL1PPCAC_5131, partial [Pristionchus entomophagus]
RQLEIDTGRMNEEIKKKLRVGFKSLQFTKIHATFTEEYSVRIISYLLQDQSGVEGVKIEWKNGVGENLESAWQMLRNLPPMKTCEIIAPNSESLINDEVFLHLIGNSEMTSMHQCISSVSSKGLAKAFDVLQMHCRKQLVKEKPTILMSDSLLSGVEIGHLQNPRQRDRN